MNFMYFLQRPREIGQKITKHIPLPEFPKELKDELKKNNLNSTLMNRFLRSHVLSVVQAEDAYLTIEEKDILGDQVVNALTLEGIKFADTYKVPTHFLLVNT